MRNGFGTRLDKTDAGAKRRGRPPKTPSAAPAGEVQSLHRGLALLQILASHEGLSLKDLAEQAELAASTTHRLLGTLAAQGFARLDVDSGRWTVGVNAFTVGSAFLGVRKLSEIARPMLKALLAETDETCNLALIDDNDIVYAAQYESHSPVRAFFRPGRRAPLTASAIGKACLAKLPAAERAQRLKRAKLKPFTPKSLTTIAALETQLAQIQRRGWALDDEEQTLGMRCIGAAIVDEQGLPVGGLSLSGPTARITDSRLAALAAKVRNAALEITRAYGGRSG